MADLAIEVVLVPRNPPATQAWLDEMLRLYPAPCEHDCWHSSCWKIRDLQNRICDRA